MHAGSIRFCQRERRGATCTLENVVLVLVVLVWLPLVAGGVGLGLLGSEDRTRLSETREEGEMETLSYERGGSNRAC